MKTEVVEYLNAVINSYIPVIGNSMKSENQIDNKINEIIDKCDFLESCIFINALYKIF